MKLRTGQLHSRGNGNMGCTPLKMDSRLRGNDREVSYKSWLPLQNIL